MGMGWDGAQAVIWYVIWYGIAYLNSPFTQGRGGEGGNCVQCVGLCGVVGWWAGVGWGGEAVGGVGGV